MSDLIARLRGIYTVGPILENGEPEFGYRTFPATPIQLEAATEIERLRRIESAVRNFIDAHESPDGSTAEITALEAALGPQS